VRAGILDWRWVNRRRLEAHLTWQESLSF
jgi:hypothetical protein